MAWISNCIPYPYSSVGSHRRVWLWNAIAYPCLRYLLLTPKSSYVSADSYEKIIISITTFQGCTKLKLAWGLNFKANFRPDFHAILCSLVRPKMFILFWVIYIYIGLKKNKKNNDNKNNNNMNNKIIFWWLLWTMALIWDEYWMLVSVLINCKVHTAKQFKGWKKEQAPGCWLRKKIQVTSN